jgi:hypothetical protein
MPGCPVHVKSKVLRDQSNIPDIRMSREQVSIFVLNNSTVLTLRLSNKTRTMGKSMFGFNKRVVSDSDATKVFKNLRNNLQDQKHVFSANSISPLVFEIVDRIIDRVLLVRDTMRDWEVNQ